MARKIPKLYPKDHPVRHTSPDFLTGSSAHRWKELEKRMNDGALEDSSFHKAKIKGSKASIIAPEEFSGSDHDQTFLQGIDIRTFEQATSHITAKIRPNSEYNIIRSEKIGFQVARVAQVDDYAFVSNATPKDVIDVNPTSSFPYSNHRFLKLDEPEYYADNYAPNSSGVKGSKAQLDTNVNKNRAQIYIKHYRERRDLGQANLFQNDIPYKDTTTVNPVEIVGSEQGEQIEFPPFMVHATDLLSTDGAIEIFPIRSVADRSIPEHPHTAQGVKSDLGLIDIYRKSITVGDQSIRRDKRLVQLGRAVQTFTSFACTQAAAGNDDTIVFTVQGITSTITLKSAEPSASDRDGSLSGTSATIQLHIGDSDAAFANNLMTAFSNLKSLGVRINPSVAGSTVFLRQMQDRSRTKGVVVSATDASNSANNKSNITASVTVGGMTIEFFRYVDLVYESGKTKSLAGYDYFLDGVESFGIEVLDNAERVKLLTASIDNPDSEDPDDRITLDSYIPWLKAGRSGTFGESHIGPINTQGFVAPESSVLPAYVDNSDDDRATVRLTDANTFSAKPNFFLTDRRNTLEGNTYTSQDNLLVQASWLESVRPFVTSSHTVFGSVPSAAMSNAGTNDNLKSDRVAAKASIQLGGTQPDVGSSIIVKNTVGEFKNYIFGESTAVLRPNDIEVDIASSVTIAGSEYANSIIGSKSANITTKVKGSEIKATFTAMPADGSSVAITMPVYDRENPSVLVTSSVKKTYVFRIDGTTGDLEGSNVIVNRGTTIAEVVANLKTAIDLRHLDTNNNSTKSAKASASIVSEKGNGLITNVIAANALTVDRRYTITFVGDTDFTKVGASSNTVGISFIATGAAPGIDRAKGETALGSTVEILDEFEFKHGTTEKQTFEITDAASSPVTKKYVIVHGGAAGTDAVATGTVLVAGSDTGSGTAGALANGIAVNIKTGDSQPNVLDELKKAIEGSTGHNGTITATKSGDQTLVLTQASAGVAGNTNIAETLPSAYTVPAKFTGGLNTATSVDASSLTLKGINLAGDNVALTYSKNITAQNLNRAIQTNQGTQITAGMASIDTVGLTQNIIEFNRLGNHSLVEVNTTNTTRSGFTGGSAFALSNTGTSGSVEFKKTSVYFPESGHFGFKSNQDRDDVYPAVSVVSGSHHFSGRKHSGTAATPGFKDDSPWTVSYWMSGSDRRADHFCSVRDIMHFRDTTSGDGLNYDTIDHYPNVPNFKVRHFLSRNYGLLYVSLYDNDFYPSNHHRVDFIFAGVRKGSTISFLRNSEQENSLYNTLAGGKSWNHLSVTYDGGMHSTVTHASDHDYKVSGGISYKNFLQALENESRHDSDTITHGPNITVQSSATLVNGEKYVIINVGEISTSDWQNLGVSGTPQRGTVFTYNNYNLSSISNSGTVRLKADTYFDTPTINDSSRTILYNYGNNKFEPHVITGSFGDGKLACPVRLHLNGVDITDGSLEYVIHYSTRTTGHNARYGLDYRNETNPATLAISYSGQPGNGNTISFEQPTGPDIKFEFDGVGARVASFVKNTDSYLQTPSYPSALQMFSADGATGDLKFSISFWISLDNNTDASTRYILAHGDNPSTSLTWQYAVRYKASSGELMLRLKDQDPASDIVNEYKAPQVDSNDILDGVAGYLNWAHIAIVHTPKTDSTPASTQFYKNGVAWGSAQAGDNSATYGGMHTSSSTTGGVFALGSYSRSGGESDALMADLSNVLIFKHDGQSGRSSSVLTPAEVYKLYDQAGTSASPSGIAGMPHNYLNHSKASDLVAYFKLDENVDTFEAGVDQVMDSSSSNLSLDHHLDAAGAVGSVAGTVSGVVVSDGYGAGNIPVGIRLSDDLTYENFESLIDSSYTTTVGRATTLNKTSNTLTITSPSAGTLGHTSVTATVANATVPAAFSGGTDIDYRDVAFTGENFSLNEANTAAAASSTSPPTKAFSGFSVMSSSIVFGGDPNATAFNKRLFKNTTTHEFFADVPAATIKYTGQPSNGNTLKLISTDTTTKTYEFRSGGDPTAGNIAVAIGANADATYAALKAAIDGATGHNAGLEGNKISVTHTEENPNTSGLITFKQSVGGSEGNTTITATLANATVPAAFVSTTLTHLTRRVHAKQNTNYISEFAMWDTKLPESQIKTVWELSRFNDVLFTVEKPMAAALTRMNASFEDGVENNHTHASKGFVFGDSEHGTDSIVFGGLKK